MTDPNRPVTGYPAPNGFPAAAHPPPPGTAYAYPASGAPPPSAFYSYQNNPYYPPNHADSVRRAICLRRIFAFVIGLIVILGASTFIMWLVLRPQLPEFRVDSVSLSNFTLSNTSVVSFNSEFRLTVRNPNTKMRLSYDEIEAMVFYRSSSLSETTVTPFSQGTRNETSITASFSSAGNVVDRFAVDGINSERLEDGNVVLNLRMLSMVKFRAKAWRTRTAALKVFCGDLIVSVPNNGRTGRLTGGLTQCRVGI